MVVVSIFFLLKPINDPDFFWHLKTGELIWELRELPANDPFNYTSPAVVSAEQRFTLTAYWLCQVVYHLLYDLLGMPGIVALRFLLALLLVPILLRLRRGDPVIHAALVLACLPLLYHLYPFDRPQAFSFLFFAVLLVLLERERTAATVPAARGSYLPIPLLMLVWANMHGGHVIGQVTIALYLALEGLKFAHPVLHPLGRERYRSLLMLGITGLAASLVNPNFYRAITMALASAPGWGNIEYLSAAAFYRQNHQSIIFVFWGALALAVMYCLSTVKKPDITWIGLLAGTGYYGFAHMRYIPFFMIAALPAIGFLLSAKRAGSWARYLVVAGSVVLVTFFTLAEVPSRERVSLALRVNSDIYPVQAADFIIANNLEGRLYNTYFWGGYLLWRLGPGRKVFVDGRGLNPQASYQSASINAAFTLSGESPPRWKSLLRQHGVGYLIMPRVSMYKGIVFDDVDNLRRALLDAPEWIPVYADAIALVFVRNAPEYREVIRKYALRKERLLDPHRTFAPQL